MPDSALAAISLSSKVPRPRSSMSTPASLPSRMRLRRTIGSAPVLMPIPDAALPAMSLSSITPPAPS
jgi:hypothetical protein